MLSKIYGIFVRVADYFDTSIDPVIAQKIVEKYAADLINELTIVSGKIVGEYEKNLPGEQKILEVRREIINAKQAYKFNSISLKKKKQKTNYNHLINVQRKH